MCVRAVARVCVCLQFAIVHLVGANNACPIKALVLVWNEKQKQFTGLIPLEQVRHEYYWLLYRAKIKSCA